MAEKKLDRRIRYTIMVIRESFIELLGEKQLSKITVKEICEKADINRATFYSHYQDQYDLLNAIEAEIIDDVKSHLVLDEQGNPNASQLTGILEYIRDNANICTILLGEYADVGFHQKVMELVQQQLVSGWTANQKITQKEAEDIFVFASTGSVGLIRKWLDEGMKKSPEEISNLIWQLTHYGIFSII